MVPLSPWAKAIIAGLPRIAGSDFCFSTNGVTSISGYSRAKRSIDAGIAELNDGTPIPPWILHDIRRSVASGMARLGVQLPVIERILNHISGPSFGGVAGIYQRHNFSDEKRYALQRGGAHVTNLVSDRSSHERRRDRDMGLSPVWTWMPLRPDAVERAGSLDALRPHL